MAEEHKLSAVEKNDEAFMKPPKRVAVTGAAGAIGYATIFRIAL